jgi:ssRNA-specific RNase YbeY (16S rRNA maturation enzyme)
VQTFCYVYLQSQKNELKSFLYSNATINQMNLQWRNAMVQPTDM